MTFTQYLERVDAQPTGHGRAYNDPNSPWRASHVLLNRTFVPAPCGCEVDGFGTLNEPVVIRFCDTHREVTP